MPVGRSGGPPVEDVQLASQIGAVVATAFPVEYAGVYFDKRGQLHLAVTGEVAEVAALVRSSFGGRASAVIVEERPNSIQTLERVAAQVWQARPMLAAEGIDLVSVGEVTDENRVGVTLGPSRNDAGAILAEQFGADVVIVVGAGLIARGT